MSPSTPTLASKSCLLKLIDQLLPKVSQNKKQDSLNILRNTVASSAENADITSMRTALEIICGKDVVRQAVMDSKGELGMEGRQLSIQLEMEDVANSTSYSIPTLPSFGSTLFDKPAKGAEPSLAPTVFERLMQDLNAQVQAAARSDNCSLPYSVQTIT